MNINRLIHGNGVERLLLHVICELRGAELPSKEKIGQNVRFPHGLKGVVLHPNTIIEDDVTIFHDVTCGRGDMYGIDPRIKSTEFRGIVLKRGCILCAGAKIICNRGVLVVGENTIIGANAVLTKSTGDNEIWGGYLQSFLKRELSNY